MNIALRNLALPAAALAVLLALTACGNNAGSAGHDMGSMQSSSTTAASPAASPVGPPATGPHNDADVTFATGMIPHHAQAVVMADMALTKATSPDVKTLAAAIKAAQNPEIQTMSGWLAGWGKPVPTSGGHDMSSMGSPTSASTAGGMMSDQEMGELGKASGTGFDRMWLQMMIKHHQGAVTMAQTQLASGANTQAKKLAQDIIDAQTKEIDQMTRLLAGLPQG